MWAELIILRQKLSKEEENSKKKKEKCQENLMAELALSAKEYIHKHMKKSAETQLDVLLAKKRRKITNSNLICQTLGRRRKVR